jgi:hypothetical protein
MDTEHCADFAIAHALLKHGEDVRSKLGFIRVTQITFSRYWQGNIEVEYMPS